MLSKQQVLIPKAKTDPMDSNRVTKKAIIKSYKKGHYTQS